MTIPADVSPFELHPDPMAVVDDEGVVRYANLSWRRWDGCAGGLFRSPVQVGQSLLARLSSTPRPDGRRAAELLGALLDGEAERGTLTLVWEGDEWCACELDLVALGVARDPAQGRAGGAVAVWIRPTSEAQERAEASERRFENLTESLDSVIFVASPDAEEGERRIDYISPSYERIWGRSRRSLIERPLSFLEVVHPEDRDEVRRNLRQQAEGTWDREFRLLLDDGTERWIHSRAFPVRDGEGEVTEVVGIATDVTARRQAQELLEASEGELDLILDRIPVGVVMLRGDRLVYANRAAAGYVGVADPDDELGRELGPQIHPDDRRRALDAVASMMAGDGGPLPRPGEVRARHVEGDWVTLDVVPVRVLELSDGPAALFVVLDVGTQRALAETLHRTQARFQAIFESSPMGIAVVGFDGSVRDLNPAMRRLLDLRPDDPTPPDVRPLVHPEGVENTLELLQGLETGRGEPQILETSVRRRDGSWRPVRVHASAALDTTATPTLAVVLVEDVSERRELEEQLRQSQRIESLGRLAGGIAHDFNNLVTVITGHAEFLLEDPALGAELREDLREIRRAGERAAALTGQLLAFSRRTVMQPRVLDLNGVVEGLTGMLGRTLGEDVHLEVELDPQLARVRVDPTQVEQVIMNLTVNARDAMPRGGVLRISTFNQLLGEDFVRTHLGATSGPHVTLRVEDTGVGMSEAIRSHIFEPFFTTKDPGKGTGLGLAMVYGIVKQSGGYIHVDTEEGAGSVFTVHLPAVEEALSDGAGSGSEDQREAGQETILLVEDEEGVRNLIERILTSRGYRVVDAPDPLAALELLEHEEHVDLVVTDVVMPGMGGGELAERVRERLPDVRVLFISGYADDEMVRHGVVAGEVPFLQKPFTGSDLLREVRGILDGA
jgi:PAS domain S-box-containing protein